MRAVSPVVGTVLLVAVTVACATAVGLGATSFSTPAPPPTAALDLSVDAAADTLTLTHRGGDALDVESLRLHVTVEGDPLLRQPPVPFVGARGFRGAPSGAFNRAAAGEWTAGEESTLRLAGTNAPLPSAGEEVRVRVYDDGTKVAELSATAT